MIIRTTGISSRFLAKDLKAFSDFLEKCSDFQEVQLITEPDSPLCSFLFVAEYQDGDGDQSTFMQHFVQHLAEGWAVSVQMHHTCYEQDQVVDVTADAFAINWQGDRHIFSLGAIEEIAATMGRTGGDDGFDEEAAS